MNRKLIKDMQPNSIGWAIIYAVKEIDGEWFIKGDVPLTNPLEYLEYEQWYIVKRDINGNWFVSDPGRKSWRSVKLLDANTSQEQYDTYAYTHKNTIDFVGLNATINLVSALFREKDWKKENRVLFLILETLVKIRDDLYDLKKKHPC